VTVRDTVDVAPRAVRPALARARPSASAWSTLIGTAAEPYRKAGRFAYGFARGKLNLDPVFRAILERDLLAGCDSVLDLGCGQGLLAAWLQGSLRCHQSGVWPRGWPSPRPRAVRGIELMAAEVARGRRALGASFEVSQGDIRSAALSFAHAIVVLDVMHYLPPPCQLETLNRIRAALPKAGVLLMRVGDADAGLRFRFTHAMDRLIMLARGHGWFSTYCRAVPEWRALLAQCGFDSEAIWMSRGTPFANVLLVGRAR
jgi:SAM-dependent methyltransferase